MTQSVDAESEQDYGADGLAALSRPSELVTVLGDRSSHFRDSGVEVRRYQVTQLDTLRKERLLTYPQWCAARHATALFRGAALLSCVTSRYDEWVSGARGKWVATDDGDDEAAPWRALVGHLPEQQAIALESLVMNTLDPRHMNYLVAALDQIAKDIGA